MVPVTGIGPATGGSFASSDLASTTAGQNR